MQRKLGTPWDYLLLIARWCIYQRRWLMSNIPCVINHSTTLNTFTSLTKRKSKSPIYESKLIVEYEDWRTYNYMYKERKMHFIMNHECCACVYQNCAWFAVSLWFRIIFVRMLCVKYVISTASCLINNGIYLPRN